PRAAFRRYRRGQRALARSRDGREARAAAGWQMRGSRRARSRPGRLLRPRAAPAGHEAVGDARLGQVVGRELAQHLVANEDADTILAHPPGGVTQNFMAILELDPE